MCHVPRSRLMTRGSRQHWGIAVVSNSSAHAERLLERVIYWIERNRPDLYVVDYQIEVIV